MNIRPSAAIRQNYNEIADMCRKTAEPIFLTKNGEGDLVVMDIETYNRREKMLKQMLHDTNNLKSYQMIWLGQRIFVMTTASFAHLKSFLHCDEICQG